MLPRRSHWDAQPSGACAVLLASDGRQDFSERAVAVAAARAEAGPVAVVTIARRLYGLSFGLPHPGLLPTKQEMTERQRWVGGAIERLRRAGREADGQVAATRKATKNFAEIARLRGARVVVIDETTATGVRRMVEGDVGVAAPQAAAARRGGRRRSPRRGAGPAGLRAVRRSSRPRDVGCARLGGRMGVRAVVATPAVLVLGAAPAGLLLPSTTAADLGDVFLGALVLCAAVTVEPRRLVAARAAWRQIAAAVVLPLCLLLPLALVLGAFVEAGPPVWASSRSRSRRRRWRSSASSPRLAEASPWRWRWSRSP